MVSCELEICEYKLRLVSRLGDYMCICIYLTAVNKLKYTVKQVAQEGRLLTWGKVSWRYEYTVDSRYPELAYLE